MDTTTDPKPDAPISYPDLSALPQHLRDHIERLRATRPAKVSNDPPAPSSEPRFTMLGTPCSRVWDGAWVERVEAAELELNRRVCGARTAAGSVCSLESDHGSGRCRFHGGFDLTGAPRGNRNAVVHGLYSRRLMVCGEHCPLWKTCPCAGPDVLKMEERERPTCPFEQTEYNALVTDGMSLVERRADANPFDKQAVHMLALLQVMMSRAAAMLGRHKFTQMVVSVNCQKHDERMSPAFAALMRLMWEYRHVRRLLPDGDGGAGATPESVAKLMLRMEVDTDLAPESQEELHFPDTPVESAAAGIVDRAVHSASEGLSERALDAYQVLMKFDPDKDNSRLKRLLLAYRPTHLKIDREFYEKLLRNTFFPSVDDLIEMGEDIDEYREELRQNIEDEKEWERLYGDGASNGENAGLTTKDAKNTNGENQGK